MKNFKNAAVMKISTEVKIPHIQFMDSKGQEVLSHIGGVPFGLNIGSDDFLNFEIDMKTGQILNWKEISLNTLETIDYEDNN